MNISFQCSKDDDHTIAIQLLTSLIGARLKPADTEAIFNDMLDSSYSFTAVGGPFASMSPSRVLKEADPTAYRCVMADYLDECDELVDVGGRYFNAADGEELQAGIAACIDGCFTT